MAKQKSKITSSPRLHSSAGAGAGLFVAQQNADEPAAVCAVVRNLQLFGLAVSDARAALSVALPTV
jgi:hypothetical protein